MNDQDFGDLILACRDLDYFFILEKDGSTDLIYKEASG